MHSSIVDDESGIDFMGGLIPAPLDLENLRPSDTNKSASIKEIVF